MGGRNIGKTYILKYIRVKSTHLLLFFVVLRCYYLQCHSLSIIASICRSDERRLYCGLFFFDCRNVYSRDSHTRGALYSFKKGCEIFLNEKIFKISEGSLLKQKTLSKVCEVFWQRNHFVFPILLIWVRSAPNTAKDPNKFAFLRSIKRNRCRNFV